jgi:hypothetical protein
MKEHLDKLERSCIELETVAEAMEAERDQHEHTPSEYHSYLLLEKLVDVVCAQGMALHHHLTAYHKAA